MTVHPMDHFKIYTYPGISQMWLLYIVKLHNSWIMTNLNDSVNWTGLLTEATVYTFSHVDVISGSSSTAVSSCLSLDCDGL